MYTWRDMGRLGAQGGTDYVHMERHGQTRYTGKGRAILCIHGETGYVYMDRQTMYTWRDNVYMERQTMTMHGESDYVYVERQTMYTWRDRL